MTTRRDHRAVFAELLLLAAPVEIAVRRDGTSLRAEFATIAELRTWLAAAGLETSTTLSDEYTGTYDDGRTYRAMDAYPTWHGWKICASATETVHSAPVLTDATRGQLEQIAGRAA